MHTRDPSRSKNDNLTTPSPSPTAQDLLSSGPISPSNFSRFYHAAVERGDTQIKDLFEPKNSLFLCLKNLSQHHFKRVWIVDADDTLWEENLHFSEIISEFCQTAHRNGSTLSESAIKEVIDHQGKLALATHGFGPVGFAEALRNSWTHLQQHGGVVYDHPEELLNRVVPYLSNVPYQFRPRVDEFLDLIEQTPDEVAILFTQGNVPIQARKVARSNLAHRFVGIALGENKNTETYKELTKRLPFKAEEFIVIGNSLSHEVRPAIELGYRAFHLDNPNAWHSGTHATIDQSLYQRVECLLEAFHNTRVAT